MANCWVSTYNEMLTFFAQISIYRGKGINDSHDLATFLSLYNGKSWSHATGKLYMQYLCYRWNDKHNGSTACELYIAMWDTVNKTRVMPGKLSYFLLFSKVRKKPTYQTNNMCACKLKSGKSTYACYWWYVFSTVSGDANFSTIKTALIVGDFTQPQVARSLLKIPASVEKNLVQCFLWIVPRPSFAPFESLGSNLDWHPISAGWPGW